MTKILTTIIIFIVIIYSAKAVIRSACPTGSRVIQGNKCIWVASVESTNPLNQNHDRAALTCEQNGGKLPSVKTPETEVQLRELANAKRAELTENNEAVYVWINLKRDPLPDGADKTDMTLWRNRTSWKWRCDDSSISEEMWRFWNQPDNEPNNFEEINEYCAVATVKADGGSTWNDVTCSNDRPTAHPTVIICEKQLACPGTC